MPNTLQNFHFSFTRLSLRYLSSLALISTAVKHLTTLSEQPPTTSLIIATSATPCCAALCCGSLRERRAVDLNPNFILYIYCLKSSSLDLRHFSLSCTATRLHLKLERDGDFLDPESKVACETCTKTNMVMVFGLDADKCKVLVNIEQQSPDIAQGVHGHLTKLPEEIGAGDQGHMFGYATDETPELMPLSHVLATKLGARLTEVRKNGTCPWLRPDGKTQVTVEYYNDNGAKVPVRVHTVLISTQHDETVTNDEIAADLKEHVIKPVIPEKYLDEKTIFHLNPSGRFVIGGPHGDAGLTGRKIIIDTYGGWGAHGGGAFSGKDPTKVDRSGAYIVRQAAKSIVASGLARRCIVQIQSSYPPHHYRLNFYAIVRKNSLAKHYLAP
ncbi:unnamed protein product [Fraxinus pennsylvanica]|uniref:S-adenosylmethionine synthase n=1 Tax=Fraxinus pennsylvanica TaxID=56036 RepID=A0AAD1ZV15_9LAMI|nr:unnamed protein product [Fraxinus pennsylvanica]